MKNIVFDTGPVISLALNNLLWVLEPLKQKFHGKFYVCESAKGELIDRPLKIKRFKFEALQVLKLIKDGTLEVIENDPLKEMTDELLDLANSSYSTHKKDIRIVQRADMEGIACCLVMGSEAYVVDERAVRAIVEDPKKLKRRLSHKLNKKVQMNKKNIKKFKEKVKHLKIIRSVELATVAYEMGLLDKYLVDVENPKETLLDGLLWGLKLNGASVSKREINQIISEEG